jgi:hypothetical protein
MPPSAEQIEAANRETRGMIATALPGAKVDRGRKIPAWAARMLSIDEDIRSAPRCRHLIERPAQPWMAHAAEHIWRCRECASEHARQSLRAGTPLWDPVEEGTCDMCRRYVGGSNLSLLVLREDLWIMTCGLCDCCHQHALANGARAWQPPARAAAPG